MDENNYSIIVSQLGYRPEDRKIGVIRCDRLESDIGVKGEAIVISAEEGKKVFIVKEIQYWGEKWGIHFWIIDFSRFKQEGSFYLEIPLIGVKSNEFKIKKSLFIEDTLVKTSVGQLDLKTGGKMGWQDCGSDLRAVEGHAVQLIGLADCFESFSDSHNKELDDKFRQHIVQRCGLSRSMPV